MSKQMFMTFRLVGLIATLLFLALPAFAQIDAILPPIGGYGGGQYVARCPEGQHLTGFRLRTGDDVDAITALCLAAYGPTEGGPIEPYPITFGGFGGGHDAQLLCPKDAPIVTGIFVGIQGHTTTIVNNIHLFCGVAAKTQAPPSEFPSAVFDGDPHVGDFDSVYGETQRCPAGLVAVGINGRSGIWLDAVGLICGAPKLTPRPLPGKVLGRVDPPAKSNLPGKTLGRIILPGRPAFIYALGNDGSLKWFRHDGAKEGKFVWEGPRVVNVGWNNFKRVFPGGDGIIYALTRQGVLMSFQHKGINNGLGKDDAGAWLPPQQIGAGWGNYTHVFSTGKGVIYGIAADGKLKWYRHTGFANGRATGIGPKDVGRGWEGLKQVFSMGDGIIYAITNDGKLKWYRHYGYLAGDGLETSGSWAGPSEVGSGWGAFTQVFATGEGIIYGITSEGKLMWFHHRGFKDGKFVWDGPTEVGHGWENLFQVFAQP